VPVLILLDSYFASNDSQYDKIKDGKRKTLIAVSFLISLFWSCMPLIGITPLTFEPSGLSCSVYQENPTMAYMAFIFCCFICFEIGPLCIVGFCKSQEKPDQKASIRVILINILLKKK
jgi:hypothetical protein